MTTIRDIHWSNGCESWITFQQVHETCHCKRMLFRPEIGIYIGVSSWKLLINRLLKWVKLPRNAAYRSNFRRTEITIEFGKRKDINTVNDRQHKRLPSIQFSNISMSIELPSLYKNMGISIPSMSSRCNFKDSLQQGMDGCLYRYIIEKVRVDID